MHAEDLLDLYDPADGFAVTVVPSRDGVAGAGFNAIVGQIDNTALEGRVINAERVMRFPAGPLVDDGDIVTLQADAAGLPKDTRLKLLETPRRVNDGLEVEVLLGSVTDD